jgi:flavin-dependent dehydrogenase
MNHETDVVILGGAFSGAAAGLLLKRQRPETRVLIIERAQEPDRKVGESTSEVAGCFLTRVLGQFRWLSQNQLMKQGLRLWFTTPENQSFEQCGEIGPHYQSRMPTFQLDRATLDPHLLEEAVAAGCELWRPARVTTLNLGGAGENTMEVKMGDEVRLVKAKWVIDASGKVATIARQRKTWHPLTDHPTNSVWARYKNVKDLDDAMLAMKYPAYATAMPTPRGVATNHLMGRGWWCWIIPLKDGDVSLGITYDPRIFTLPEGPNQSQRLLQHVLQHPVGAYLFSEATVVEKDTRSYSQLPYYTDQVAGDGWTCCGDAAGFMDPLYSQGLDYCGHTCLASVDIVVKALNGEDVTKTVEMYNHNFTTSYFRWYRALYKDKYHYLGDQELMWAAFLLDIGTYFVGPARLVYDGGISEWLKLPYHGPWGAAFAAFMRLYNRRLVKIAQKRYAAGVYGARNLGRRQFPKQGFSPDPKVLKIIRMGIYQWLKCEWHALWLRPKAMPAVTATVAQAVPADENSRPEPVIS